MSRYPSILSTVEPQLSKLCERHITNSDNQGVRMIKGVSICYLLTLFPQNTSLDNRGTDNWCLSCVYCCLSIFFLHAVLSLCNFTTMPALCQTQTIYLSVFSLVVKGLKLKPEFACPIFALKVNVMMRNRVLLKLFSLNFNYEFFTCHVKCLIIVAPTPQMALFDSAATAYVLHLVNTMRSETCVPRLFPVSQIPLEQLNKRVRWGSLLSNTYTTLCFHIRSTRYMQGIYFYWN